MSKKVLWSVLVLFLIILLGTACTPSASEKDLKLLQSQVQSLTTALQWTQKNLLAAEDTIKDIQSQSAQLQNKLEQYSSDSSCSVANTATQTCNKDDRAILVCTQPFLSPCYSGPWSSEFCNPCSCWCPTICATCNLYPYSGLYPCPIPPYSWCSPCDPYLPICPNPCCPSPISINVTANATSDGTEASSAVATATITTNSPVNITVTATATIDSPETLLASSAPESESLQTTAVMDEPFLNPAAATESLPVTESVSILESTSAEMIDTVTPAIQSTPDAMSESATTSETETIIAHTTESVSPVTTTEDPLGTISAMPSPTQEVLQTTAAIDDPVLDPAPVTVPLPVIEAESIPAPTAPEVTDAIVPDILSTPDPIPEPIKASDTEIIVTPVPQLTTPMPLSDPLPAYAQAATPPAPLPLDNAATIETTTTTPDTLIEPAAVDSPFPKRIPEDEVVN
jgi:hypothetical protein